MARDDASFPTEKALNAEIPEGAQELMGGQGSSYETWGLNQTPPQGDRQQARFYDEDDPCRSALMDCYNR